MTRPLHRHRARSFCVALISSLALTGGALAAAPAAGAEDDGWVHGEVAPPIPPDQAGDPQPSTGDWSQIPDVPPEIRVPLQIPPPPSCSPKQKHKASAAKKGCKKKRK